MPPVDYMNGEITAPGTESMSESDITRPLPEARDAATTPEPQPVYIVAPESLAQSPLPSVEPIPVPDTSHDGVPLIMAPSVDELAALGLLDIVDEGARLTYLHEQLPVTKEQLMPRIDPAQDHEYEATQLEHAVLRDRAATAVDSLVRVMRPMAGKSYGENEITSRHQGAYVLPDGEHVPVVRHAALHVVGSELMDPPSLRDDSGAIKVVTQIGTGFPGQEDRSLTPIEAKHIPDNVIIKRADFAVTPLPQVVRRIRDELCGETWKAAVAPWAAAYTALPLPRTAVPPHDALGIPRLVRSEHDLLTGGHVPPEAASRRLAAVFGRLGIERTMTKLAEIPPDELMARLDRHGLMPRYSWLLHNAEEIHAAVATAEASVMRAGFGRAYAAWRVGKEAGVNRVAALADELARLRRIA
jgi:hypothetical protein